MIGSVVSDWVDAHREVTVVGVLFSLVVCALLAAWLGVTRTLAWTVLGVVGFVDGIMASSVVSDGNTAALGPLVLGGFVLAVALRLLWPLLWSTPKRGWLDE